MALNQLRESPSFGFIDWTLRGVGQVVFQNNPWSGLVILLGILFNSWIYAMVCVVGVLASMLTAILLKADRALIRDGLFGFNGALVALALIAFSSENFQTGAVPSLAMWFYLVCGAALSTMAFSAIAALLGPHKVAPLTMPFVLIGWLFLFAILKFDAIHAGPMLKPVSPDQFSYTEPYVTSTWYVGIGTSIGQIFFQDNWITGYIILIGILIHSRIGGGMCLLGAIVGTVVAGAGFGMGFLGAMRMVLAVTPVEHRGGVTSAVYVVGYLAFSLPAVVAGVVAGAAGLERTAIGYAAIMVVLALTAVIGNRRRSEQLAPLRNQSR